MATAKPRSYPQPRRWRRRILFAAVMLVIAGFAWLWRPLNANAVTAAAYGARIGCSCRFIARRTLSDCRRDFEPGMGFVVMSDDGEARSVTAWFPLLARQTATFHPGEGCRLDPWKD